MITLHLIGFPHTALDGHLTCAFTQKVRKFAAMGWDNLRVYHGGGEQIDPAVPPTWPTPDEWAAFNRRVCAELEDANDGDMVLLSGGWDQLGCLDGHEGRFLVAEPGVGYQGVIPWTHHAYESTAWRHYVYGKNGWDGRPFDTVIPNYFDPADFPHVNPGGGDFLLFVGRVVLRKGVLEAVEVARRLDMPLVVAGPGPTEWGGNRIVAPEVTLEGCEMRYVGVLDTAARAELMASAACLLAPTRYVEPFGGVAVEAMMCGTPVVATEWGAFTETVEPGLTGYLGNTLQTLTDGVLRAIELPTGAIRRAALDRYSLEAVRPRYEAWFDRLETLWGGGYYADTRDMMGVT